MPVDLLHIPLVPLSKSLLEPELYEAKIALVAMGYTALSFACRYVPDDMVRQVVEEMFLIATWPFYSVRYTHVVILALESDQLLDRPILHLNA